MFPPWEGSPFPVTTRTLFPLVTSDCSNDWVEMIDSVAVDVNNTLPVPVAGKMLSVPGVMSLMVMSYGSNNHSPASPSTELTSTRSGLAINMAPEVSTRPPSPPSGPPFARNVPSATVPPDGLFKSLQITTVPPFPSPVEEASTKEPGCIQVCTA